MNLSNLSDKDLLAKTEELVGKEREVLTEVLRHLREIQRRRLYADLGLPSLFEYCTKTLKYSESQAHRRIVAMRLIIEIPQIEEKVTNGDLSLSNLAQAKAFFNQEEKATPLKPEEKLKVLCNLENKSARDGKKFLLSKGMQPPKEIKRQVSAELTEIKLHIDDKFLAKLDKLKGLLAHRLPSVNNLELIKFLAEFALGKFDPDKKQKPTLLSTSKVKTIKCENIKCEKRRPYINTSLRNSTWQASANKCAQCRSEFALQIDHVNPISQGGSNQGHNLRLLCRNCNQREAIKKVGQNKMDKFINKNIAAFGQ